MRLLNCDASICTRIQCRFRKAGVPILSVHDSFIVPKSREAELFEIMEFEINAACQNLRLNG